MLNEILNMRINLAKSQKIYYDKKSKTIYSCPSKRELAEEGIEIFSLPWQDKVINFGTTNYIIHRQII